MKIFFFNSAFSDEDNGIFVTPTPLPNEDMSSPLKKKSSPTRPNRRYEVGFGRPKRDFQPRLLIYEKSQSTIFLKIYV